MTHEQVQPRLYQTELACRLMAAVVRAGHNEPVTVTTTDDKVRLIVVAPTYDAARALTELLAGEIRQEGYYPTRWTVEYVRSVEWWMHSADVNGLSVLVYAIRKEPARDAVANLAAQPVCPICGVLKP